VPTATDALIGSEPLRREPNALLPAKSPSPEVIAVQGLPPPQPLAAFNPPSMKLTSELSAPLMSPLRTDVVSLTNVVSKRLPMKVFETSSTVESPAVTCHTTSDVTPLNTFQLEMSHASDRPASGAPSVVIGRKSSIVSPRYSTTDRPRLALHADT